MAGMGQHSPASLACLLPLQSKWEDGDVAWDIVRRGPEPLRSQVHIWGVGRLWVCAIKSWLLLGRAAALTALARCFQYGNVFACPCCAAHHGLLHGAEHALHAPPAPPVSPKSANCCVLPCLQFTIGYSMVLNLLYTPTCRQPLPYLPCLISCPPPPHFVRTCLLCSSPRATPWC